MEWSLTFIIRMIQSIKILCQFKFSVNFFHCFSLTKPKLVKNKQCFILSRLTGVSTDIK